MKPIPPRRKAHGEMLPLMDMIFLLLVIFIFMIVQMRPNFGVSVELPDIGKSELTDNKDKSVVVTVSVTKDSKVYINEAEAALSHVMTKVNAIAKGADKKDLAIILRGDKGANYGQMMKLFTLFRENSINEILFDVNPEK